jgi:hypothetical protein
MDLQQQFKALHPRGRVAVTPSLAEHPDRSDILAAVNLSEHPQGFFSFEGELHFWTVGELASDDPVPVLLVGPIAEF